MPVGKICQYIVVRTVIDAYLPLLHPIGHPEELNYNVFKLAWTWHFYVLSHFLCCLIVLLKTTISLGIPVPPVSTCTKCCMADNHRYLSPIICFNLSNSSSVYSTYPARPLYQKYKLLMCVPLCPCVPHETNQHKSAFTIVHLPDYSLIVNSIIHESQQSLQIITILNIRVLHPCAQEWYRCNTTRSPSMKNPYQFHDNRLESIEPLDLYLTNFYYCEQPTWRWWHHELGNILPKHLYCIYYVFPHINCHPPILYLPYFYSWEGIHINVYDF